ncbi:MAG: class I tRNA ligase family protein, partial [Patescibacteria group bacterium]
ANYRNFTNKLWNIARYIMTSVNDVQSIEDVEAVTLADRWILGRLGKVTEKVTKHFENYEYSLAGETLRDFTWNEFADWYLEISKIQKDANTDKILLHILERVLIMWHPFMPFVTEEIYKRFDQGMLIVASWPEVKTKLAKKDEKLFAEMQGVISALRNVRARYKIPNKEKLSAIIVAGTHLQDQSEIIKKLARVENLSFDDKATKPSGSSSAVIGNIQVYVPLEGIVNLEAEKQKLGKELAQVGAYTASLTKKLANESFIRNAPEEVVEQQRQALKEAEEKEQVLKQEIDNLE